MKKIVLIAFLLFVSLAFSQTVKDSLLMKDVEQIHEKLKFMHYLDMKAMEYWPMPVVQKNNGKAFLEYFKGNILSNNPQSSMDILKYLGVNKEYIPTNWEDFVYTVNDRNAEELMAITDKYGFPSDARMKKYTDYQELDIFAITIRPNKYNNKLNRVLKKEVKAGNISEQSYDFFKLLSGRREPTKEEMATFKKQIIEQIVNEKK